MYKKIQNRQFGLKDFNQPIGLEMNPNNRWVVKASNIPWDEIEEKYASLFESHTGNVAKPLRMALGSLIIITYSSVKGLKSKKASSQEMAEICS